ncbi:MAG: NAD/NADP octopine/nopaline dehydrogenase family protein, partial [Pseudomonadota bacterium]
GYPAPHFPLSDHYSTDRWMYGNLAHDKLTGSGDWREPLVLTEHRYMREDIAIGLALLVSVAEWAGVACPVARGLLALGGAVCGEDFGRTGRTLEALGLAKLDRAGMTALMENGP